VIKNYIDLAKDWITCIKGGLSIDGCYPFDAEPTIELVELLEKRISFMEDSLIPNIENLTLEISNQ
jgi:hypothetical protein